LNYGEIEINQNSNGNYDKFLEKKRSHTNVGNSYDCGLNMEIKEIQGYNIKGNDIMESGGSRENIDEQIKNRDENNNV